MTFSKHKITAAIAAIAMITATAAHATTFNSVYDNGMDGDAQMVRIEGEIHKVEDSNEFVVKEFYNGEKIDVVYDGKTYPLQHDGSTLPLIEGETVHIEGVVDNGLFGTTVIADTVLYISVI